jgi:hypothetical protein
MNVSWTTDERRGYKEFRERRPWYTWPEGTDNKLEACFLEKKLGVEQEV